MMEKTTGSSHIMAMIKSGELRMTPKRRFVLLAVLTAAGLALLVLVSIFLANVIFYDERLGGGFPWLVLLGAALCFGLAVIISKRFDFSYRVRLIALIAASILIITGLAFGLSRTNINQHLESYGPMKHLYQRQQGRPDNGQMHKNMRTDGAPQQDRQGGTQRGLGARNAP